MPDDNNTLNINDDTDNDEDNNLQNPADALAASKLAAQEIK
jgi:hypothetical protein